MNDIPNTLDKLNLSNELIRKIKEMALDAPMYGTLALELVYHGGKIVRVLTRKEESQQIV
jgi:hypothetical protein